MSDARSDLADFLQQQSGEPCSLPEDADVFDRLGLDGDDAFEFMDRFVARFAVDTSKYRWYFHHGEEGWNIGGLVFPPPYRRVERAPITPRLLVEAIETKHWPLAYPEHALPKVRWDVRLNQLLIVLVLIPLALGGWRFWVR
ncbi:MAG: DUF1493 family protein [Spirochaetaceae bacterium]|nr:DUF1493 family protein [Spirochaetaceae bacterium]